MIIETLATVLILGLIWLSVLAYFKYRNDNFNPYK
jgi:hypothetical protein